jgi:RNA polymerase sigma-70 factor, ECF subfamily
MADVQGRVALVDADDATLAERAADGEVRAFEVLVRRYGPLMRAYARRTLGRSDEVDDVVQETFVTAWGALSTLENPARVKSWLMRIVSRRSIDRIRARWDHADVDELDPAADDAVTPERIVEAGSRREAVRTALDRLPEQQRRCWIAKEVLGATYDEIAEDLGVPPSTVRGLLSRARKNMITQLEGWR